MGFFKERITEQRLALLVLQAIGEGLRSQWPQTQTIFRNTFGADKFVLVDERLALYDLDLVAIALEIQVVRNVFKPDQANRLTDLILDLVKRTHTPAGLEKLAHYLDLVDQANQLSVNPAMQVAQQLLAEWLGPAISNFQYNLEGTTRLDPMLVMTTATTLATFVGYSKRAKEKYRIVAG